MTPQEHVALCRSLRTAHDNLAGNLTDAQIAAMPPVHIAMNVMPVGGSDSLADAQRTIAAVDALALALVGEVGTSRQMPAGTWHHDAHGHIDTTLTIAIFAEVPTPATLRREREIAALKSEVEQLRQAVATDVARVTVDA